MASRTPSVSKRFAIVSVGSKCRRARKGRSEYQTATDIKGDWLVAGYATRLSSFYIDTFAGRADEDELFQTRSKLWDRSEMLHGVAARGAY